MSVNLWGSFWILQHMTKMWTHLCIRVCILQLKGINPKMVMSTACPRINVPWFQNIFQKSLQFSKQFWFNHVKHKYLRCDMCDFGCCSVKRGCVTNTYVNQPQNTIYTGSVGQANNAAWCHSQSWNSQWWEETTTVTVTVFFYMIYKYRMSCLENSLSLLHEAWQGVQDIKMVHWLSSQSCSVNQ